MKKAVIIGIILVLVILPIVWYLASPLFIDKEINEELPLGNEESINDEIIVEPIYLGTFSGADSFHKVEGSAKVISADSRMHLRLENFKSTNGPDLKVYLSKDLDADEYVSLGELKGNIGNQNYEIPAGTNIEEYKYVLIWCEQFSVLFGHAELKKKL